MFDAVSRSVAREMARQIPQAHIDDLWQEGRVAVWLRRDAMSRLDPEHARRAAAQTARWAMLDWARRMWPQRGKSGQMIAGSVDGMGGSDRPGWRPETVSLHRSALAEIAAEFI